MKLITNFLLIVTLGFSAFADERENVLLGIINEELGEVQRLSKQMQHSDAKILLRAAELYLEKARILKEEENRRFLKVSYKKRRKINKKKFFAKSRKYFGLAQRTCDIILSKFKRFRYKSVVYYILAYNAKEFGKINKSRRYFNESLKYSKNSASIHNKSKLALAEMHFNVNEHDKAIRLYESSLKNVKNKWWTKDSYNLAWSYYRVNQFSRAITMMKNVIIRSKNNRYVDMRSKAYDDLALFFVSANKTNDAIKYYQSEGLNISEKLLRIGKLLVDQEKKTTAQSVLEKAKKLSTSREISIDANIALLGLYEKYQKYSPHLRTSKDLYKIHTDSPLGDTERDTLLYQVKKMGAVLQKQVASKRYKTLNKAKKAKAALASEYFLLVSKLDVNKPYKNVFLSAETQYAADNFNQAIPLYNEAYIVASQKKDKKLMLASIKGMLAAFGGDRISKATKSKYLELTYKRYLGIDKRSKRANIIYQKLYTFYVNNKNYDAAESLLLDFAKYHRKDRPRQEAMIAKLLDYYKGNNNHAKYKSLVAYIKSGKVRSSKRFYKKVNQTMLVMQFENVEKATSRGDKVEALKGYTAIFHDPASSNDAKKNAAYNIATLYYELANPRQTYIWATKALGMMNYSDIRKLASSLNVMAIGLFELRKFDESYKLNKIVLDKTCKKRIKNKENFFVNSVRLLISESKFKLAYRDITNASKCGISKKVVYERYEELLTWLISANKVSLIEQVVNKLDDNKYYRPILFPAWSKLKDEYLDRGRTRDANAMRNVILVNYKKLSKAQKKSLNAVSADIVGNEMLVDVDKEVQTLYNIELRFPEKTYNLLIQNKFKKLEEITSKCVEIIETGAPKSLVKAYQYYIESYQRTAQEIQEFVPPQKSDDYVKSFKKGMKDISSTLVTKSLGLIKQAKKIINRDKILSKENYWFESNKRLPILLEYSYSKNGILMDKGGRR